MKNHPIMESKNRSRVLLAEDDPNLGSVLTEYLELKGFFVHLCKDGEAALKAFESNRYDFLVIDVMMPKKDGFTLLKEIRKTDKNIPALFLTAKSQKDDRINGLKIGADDYLTKPFSMEELLFRIRAVLKRYNIALSKKDNCTFCIGKYTFDSNKQIIKIGKKEEKLTSKESELLELLCLQKNTVVTRERILESIWGSNDYFKGRSMDVFITRLRKYLKGDKNVTILNVHGTGYKLVISD